MAGEPVAPPDAPGPSAAERRVAALAAEGRERQAAAIRAEQSQALRRDREDQRALERLGRANVRAALLEAPRGRRLPLVPLFSVIVIAATLLLALADQGRWKALGLALLALGCGGFFVVRWALGFALLRGERAWLASLPFPVDGYLRVLGEPPEEERQVRLRIRFAGAPPAREVIEGMFGRVTVPATARLVDGAGSTWQVESGPIRTLFIDDMQPTNATTLGWMRGVIGEALLPIHEAHPLAIAEFGP